MTSESRPCADSASSLAKSLMRETIGRAQSFLTIADGIDPAPFPGPAGGYRDACTAKTPLPRYPRCHQAGPDQPSGSVRAELGLRMNDARNRLAASGIRVCRFLQAFRPRTRAYNISGRQVGLSSKRPKRSRRQMMGVLHADAETRPASLADRPHRTQLPRRIVRSHPPSAALRIRGLFLGRSAGGSQRNPAMSGNCQRTALPHMLSGYCFRRNRVPSPL